MTIVLQEQVFCLPTFIISGDNFFCNPHTRKNIITRNYNCLEFTRSIENIVKKAHA